MKLGATVNVGGFNSMKFESSEHGTNQECARDLIAQMEPLMAGFPILSSRITMLKTAYNL